MLLVYLSLSCVTPWWPAGPRPAGRTLGVRRALPPRPTGSSSLRLSPTPSHQPREASHSALKPTARCLSPGPSAHCPRHLGCQPVFSEGLSPVPGYLSLSVSAAGGRGPVQSPRVACAGPVTSGLPATSPGLFPIGETGEELGVEGAGSSGQRLPVGQNCPPECSGSGSWHTCPPRGFQGIWLPKRRLSGDPVLSLTAPQATGPRQQAHDGGDS